MTYVEKLAGISELFERNVKEISYEYALSELRQRLNLLSNLVLLEQQTTRDRPVNLLELASKDWKEGERT